MILIQPKTAIHTKRRELALLLISIGFGSHGRKIEETRELKEFEEQFKEVEKLYNIINRFAQHIRIDGRLSEWVESDLLEFGKLIDNIKLLMAKEYK